MDYLKVILYPFSILYGIINYVRNVLYDVNLFKSKSFNTPIISVGNLSVGGTGKTPHIEYLIRLLSKKKLNIATISRGYKRNTKGFIIGEKGNDYRTIGDEPTQFLEKFNNITVAVDEDRCHGIEEVLKQKSETDIILLDDAYQHRAVKAGLSILLTDYHNLYSNNLPLPSGTLREFKDGAKRADIIIVTKIPIPFSPLLKRGIINEIKPKKEQQLYFSYIEFGDLIPLSKDNSSSIPSSFSSVLLFTGIANPYPLEEHLRKTTDNISKKRFSDHHNYSNKDIQSIIDDFNAIPGDNKAIITTEKDAVRLMSSEKKELIKDLPIFYVPIEINIYNGEKEKFDNQILEYVNI